MLNKKEIIILISIFLIFILMMYFIVYKRINYSDVKNNPCELYAKINNMNFVERTYEFNPFICTMWNKTKLQIIKIENENWFDYDANQIINKIKND